MVRAQAPTEPTNEHPLGETPTTAIRREADDLNVRKWP
jgi:hypothetical protein